ncbi:ImmA/IrrE family metallo-endopeptidase [Listeria monocytogenes]|uniref:ImmA/IrrE family metallo-endopeptidase n=1 Tax=Listeria seeligeri TaxID=1640 RepID=UPI0018397A26|nr:ImmA/IrrE family metallo-endopeptidase [Listeria seeligeri]EAG7825415.1 ImmA/IrrE family metallo-endopeptidase [Listeria monocytogenes]MBF2653911.1 ImmA/IrrE family metallo-endopeptidase [Listeria seeligeri]
MWLDKYREQYPELTIIEDGNMETSLKGLYYNSKIFINPDQTDIEIRCTLAEEVGHHERTAGNIIAQKTINDIKQERLARNWGYESLVPLRKIIDAYYEGFTEYYEVADYLEVTEEFLKYSIKYYKNKYGNVVECNGYVIVFTNSIQIIAC